MHLGESIRRCLRDRVFGTRNVQVVRDEHHLPQEIRDSSHGLKNAVSALQSSTSQVVEESNAFLDLANALEEQYQRKTGNKRNGQH